MSDGHLINLTEAQLDSSRYIGRFEVVTSNGKSYLVIGNKGLDITTASVSINRAHAVSFSMLKEGQAYSIYCIKIGNVGLTFNTGVFDMKEIINQSCFGTSPCWGDTKWW